jgi:hypothetical protein
VHPSPSSNR